MRSTSNLPALRKSAAIASISTGPAKISPAMKPAFASLMFAVAMIRTATAVPPTPLDRFLDDCSSHDSETERMVGQELHSPGYHTTLANGLWVHSTTQSLDYALGLLDRHASGDRQRAAQILAKVIGLQDTDAAHKTCGIWPWFMEEPVAKM